MYMHFTNFLNLNHKWNTYATIRILSPMAHELSFGKSVCILAIVVGCFAILWPNIFYPMLKGSLSKAADGTRPTLNNLQDQVPYARPNLIHPTMRERNVPLPKIPARKTERDMEVPPPPPTSILNTKKPQIPGMRPPMGGGSNIQSQIKGSGTMGFLMPMYTIGIVIFFGYTIVKLLCKTRDNSADYTQLQDPDFCRIVFNNNTRDSRAAEQEKNNGALANDPTSRLGWQEKDIRDIEISQLRRKLAELEVTMERVVKQMNLVSQAISKPLNEDTDEPSREEEKLSVNQTHETCLMSREDMLKETDAKLCDVCEEWAANEQTTEQTTTDEQNTAIEISNTDLRENSQSGEHQDALPTQRIVLTPEIKLEENSPVKSEILTVDVQTESMADETSSIILERDVTFSEKQNTSETNQPVICKTNARCGNCKSTSQKRRRRKRRK